MGKYILTNGTALSKASGGERCRSHLVRIIFHWKEGTFDKAEEKTQVIKRHQGFGASNSEEGI